MATLLQLTQERRLLFGEKVSKAAANLPQSTNTVLFTVAGGRVILTALVGKVTTVIQSQATTLKLTAYPTTGTAADMCATTDMNAKEVGTLVSITGLATDALTAVSSGFVGTFTRHNIVVDVGTIKWVTAASSTGQMSWDLFYCSLDDGATVS
jgi:hypothetical protein